MPVKTRHPIFRDEQENVRDADDDLLDIGVGNSISDFVDHLAGVAKKYQEEEDE